MKLKWLLFLKCLTCLGCLSTTYCRRFDPSQRGCWSQVEYVCKLKYRETGEISPLNTWFYHCVLVLPLCIPPPVCGAASFLVSQWDWVPLRQRYSCWGPWGAQSSFRRLKINTWSLYFLYWLLSYCSLVLYPGVLKTSLFTLLLYNLSRKQKKFAAS